MGDTGLLDDGRVLLGRRSVRDCTGYSVTSILDVDGRQASLALALVTVV